MSKIMIYATHTCTYCHMVMDWLKNKDIEYDTKFIDTDLAAASELNDKLHGNIPGVPVIIIDGKDEQAIVGFDRQAMIEQLAAAGVEVPADEAI